VTISLFSGNSAGAFGPFRLYSGPTAAGPEFSHRAEPLETIVLVGDDLLGDAVGFDISKDFRLVEADPRGEAEETEEQTSDRWVRALLDETTVE